MIYQITGTVMGLGRTHDVGMFSTYPDYTALVLSNPNRLKIYQCTGVFRYIALGYLKRSYNVCRNVHTETSSPILCNLGLIDRLPRHII